jgi:hypothetical protein
LRKGAKVLRKLNELTGGHNHAHGGGGPGQGHDGVDYASTAGDKYLDILKDKVTLHYDLSKLQTLETGAEKKKEKKGKEHGHGHEREKPKKGKGGVVQHVSYKDEHAGHDHFEEDMAARNTEAGINKVIKAAAVKRYGPTSAQTDQYIEVAEKFVKRNPKILQTSMDAVDKTDCQQFGYILNDFRTFETVKIWSDLITLVKLEKKKKMYVAPDMVQSKLAQTKISQNPGDNIRVMRQLRFQIMYSNKLQNLQLTGIKMRPEGWSCISEGLERSRQLIRMSIQNCNVAERNHLELLSVGLKKTQSLEYLDLQCSALTDSHGHVICSIIKE